MPSAPLPAPRVWTWRDAGRHGPLIRGANLAAAALGYARKRFVADAFEEAAARKTGLHDFGDRSYREGLEVLCRAYNAESKLTGLGQFAARQMIVGTLSKRLQLVDWVKTHPEVRGEVIEKPWIITGLPRSGTTLGAALLDLDHRVRVPLVWEVDFPIPPSTLATRVTDPRIAASVKQARVFDRLVPSMKAIHPMEAGYPQECVVITQMDFKSVLFMAPSIAPEYAEWYATSDLLPAYRLHKQLLQSWQAAIPTLHWGSKAPNHMQGIGALMEVYPDARMIWSHRDPLVCIPSLVSLFLTFIRTHTRETDPKLAGEVVNRLYLKNIERMMAYDRARPDRDWCHHLYYNELMRDPVATFQQAYRHFDDELDPLHERKIRAWIAQRPKDSFGVHGYSLADFGLDPQRMREQYGEYIERYRVPAEYKDR